MDACEPGLGRAQSWPKNKGLEPRAVVYEGLRPGCPSLGAHPWIPWRQTEEGVLYRGRLTFPASLV